MSVDSIPSWILPGTGSSVLNGVNALSERARLHAKVEGCCTGPALNVQSGNVSACCDLRIPQSGWAQGAIVPPPSVYLSDKLSNCSQSALTASEARRLAAAALSGVAQRSGEVLIQQRVAEVEACSTDPFSTTTRFIAYRGPFIPPACPPLPPPPTNPIPTACVPPPGSRGF